MDYISVKVVAERWNISQHRVQKLYDQGRIPNVKRFGRSWIIPDNEIKPVDLRRKPKTEINQLKGDKNA